MAVQHANIGIVKKDLQLYYNREFSKSFRGESTTNLYSTVGAGALNTYPSSGNSWGTYRDSLYNGGVYGSIGTIASVSVDNVITVSSPTAYFNSFATYDVIQPQSTGGGVTAATNYYFKRLTSTTFTLHQYDGTDNASKTPEQVLTYINSDTRISVNGTSFPTMWWGYPHLPNVALIKTAITNGFAYDNRLHDCVRLNWFRSDRSDGMAYGVQPTYIANTQYAFTAYIRATSQNAIGGTVSISAYQSGTATYPTITGASSPILTSNWQKWTGTFTSSATGGIFYFYFFPAIATLPATVDIAEMQLEQKSYASEFTPTSRSANTVAGGGGLLDMSGNNVNADLTNVLFNSSGYYFNGSSNSIYLGTELNLQNGTICAWVNPSISTATTYHGIVTKTSGGTAGTQTWYMDWFSGNTLRGGIGDSSGAETVSYTWNPTISTWYFISFVFDSSYLYLYINGTLVAGPTTRTKICQNTAHPVYIGRAFEQASYAWNGQIGQVTINRTALTAAEVLQNFNATRKTYGI
jgi:hypothetical protein